MFVHCLSVCLIQSVVYLHREDRRESFSLDLLKKNKKSLSFRICFSDDLISLFGQFDQVVKSDYFPVCSADKAKFRPFHLP